MTPSIPENRTGTESAELRFHAVAPLRCAKGSAEEVLGSADGPLSRVLRPLTHHRERDARDATGRRSRLFRNGDAPASRIAEGLHCASATRTSSTQPPRSARGTAPVCTRGYLYGWLRVCTCVCVCARATSSHSSVVYQTVSPPS